ncbi:MAG: squalene/phytoene synthase family protein [Candidatus Sericytochromatia bacterium]|nr:squalene/phytoene synthase family protein [Candidatus Sericytochromatia bacterium]
MQSQTRIDIQSPPALSSATDGDPCEFYQAHLERVSRSFAFCLAQLDAPFREWLSLAYLLFRLLDTVEDATWPTPELQQLQFQAFDAFVLDHRVDAAAITAWAARFPGDIPEGEQRLLTDTATVLAHVHALPPAARTALLRCYSDMSTGMQHFCASGLTGFETSVVLNQYCFYVAGVIGELTNDLLAAARPELALAPERLVDCYHLGLALQKVNILKDQRTDEQVGRRFFTDRDALLASLVGNLPGALRCVLAMPGEIVSLRLFCAWSLFMGMATIPWVVRSWEEDVAPKLPRAETALLLAEIDGAITDADALQRLYERLAAALPVTTPSADSHQPVAVTLPAGYRGNLGAADLHDLLVR